MYMVLKYQDLLYNTCMVLKYRDPKLGFEISIPTIHVLGFEISKPIMHVYGNEISRPIIHVLDFEISIPKTNNTRTGF